jgi:hypothetical protein
MVYDSIQVLLVVEEKGAVPRERSDLRAFIFIRIHSLWLSHDKRIVVMILNFCIRGLCFFI